MARILMIADDLSGAADCAVACAVEDLASVVLLSEAPLQTDAEVLAIDSDTRDKPASDAAASIARLVRCWGRGEEQILFKKVDSTLRGNIGAEVAAALLTWRSLEHRRSAVVVAAPAFPALGRTMIGGRQWLDGVQLQPDLPLMLAAAGLRTEQVGLAMVRSGQLAALIKSKKADFAAFVCDAQTDADLHSIATAAAALRQSAVWVGSAGLARFLPAALNRVGRNGPKKMPEMRRGPVLVVVGSLAALSRRQAAALFATNQLDILTIQPHTLLAGPATPEWRDGHNILIQALTSGRDALIVVGDEERIDGMGPCLANALASFVAPSTAIVGGLILTGGETARAVLAAFDVRSLVPVHEVERGVPFALACMGNGERLGVITKAGAFGDSDTLARCHSALRNLLRSNE